MAADKTNVVAFGIRLTPAVHEQLRRLAFDSRISINSLLLEGAELVLAQRMGTASLPAPQPRADAAA